MPDSMVCCAWYLEVLPVLRASEPLDAGPAEVPDAGPVDLSFEVLCSSTASQVRTAVLEEA